MEHNWGRTVGEGHLDPSRAVRATELVQPRLVVPIHWGTYSPVRLRRGEPTWLREPVLRFESDLTGLGAGDRLRLLEPGGGLVLPAPESPSSPEPAAGSRPTSTGTDPSDPVGSA